MSNITADLESVLAKLENIKAVQIAEADLKALGKSTLSFIETNGCAALIAIAQAALASVEAGTSFGAVVSLVESEAVKQGVAVAKGAAGVVVAAVQADLAAVGSINSPGTAAPVATPVVAAPVVVASS